MKDFDTDHYTYDVVSYNPDIDVRIETQYFIYNDGAIKIGYDFIPGAVKLPELPRIGLNVALPACFDNMEWYGRGPGESYPDRLSSSLIGLYSSSVMDQYHPYVRAQETGNHCDMRWLKLTDNQGRGLMIKGDSPLCMGAWCFTQSEIDYVPSWKERRHGGSIVKGDFVTLNIDYKMMGVGGDNTWGAKVHPEYTISPEPMHFSFTLIPISSDQINITEIELSDYENHLE